MRHIEIPKAADVQGIPNTAKPLVTFADFFIDILVTQLPRSNGSEIQMCATLIRKLGEAKAETEVELKESEHEVLEKALQKVSLPGRLQARVLPFYSAIYDAPDRSRTAN